jgi:hypothetical protein
LIHWLSAALSTRSMIPWQYFWSKTLPMVLTCTLQPTSTRLN